MYKIVENANNKVSIHDVHTGKFLFSFPNSLNVTATKPLSSCENKGKPGLAFHKLPSKEPTRNDFHGTSEFENRQTKCNQFYNCNTRSDTFQPFKGLGSCDFHCVASKADSSSKVAQYPWSADLSAKSLQNVTKENHEIVRSNQNLFLQTLGLHRRGETMKRAKKSYRDFIQLRNSSIFSSKQFYNPNSKEHTIAFSSPLGKIITDHRPMPHLIADNNDQAWFIPRRPLWYEKFCGNRIISKKTVSYLRERNIPPRSYQTPTSKNGNSVHVYAFSTQQRLSRYHYLRTGLTKEGLRLKRMCRKCFVLCERLPRKVSKQYEAKNQRWANYKNKFQNTYANASRPKLTSKHFSASKQKIAILREICIKIPDIRTRLCLGYDDHVRVCQTSILVNTFNLTNIHMLRTCRTPQRCPNSSPVRDVACRVPEVIDLVSDDEEEAINVEDDESDNEITVSKRLVESLNMFNIHKNDSSLTKAGHQPTTHLFKCHACKGVEHLYHSRASLYIQQHMSNVHMMKHENMYSHLVEHQQDFGSYFVIVVEAFPNLSSSPSKYQSNLKHRIKELS